MFFGLLTLACVLSGYWSMMAYALLGVLVYGIVLAYALYLENRAQTEVERRHRARTMRPKPRREYFPSAASSSGTSSSARSGYS